VFTIYEREFPLDSTLSVAVDNQDPDPRLGCAVPADGGSADTPTGMFSLHS